MDHTSKGLEVQVPSPLEDRLFRRITDTLRDGAEQMIAVAETEVPDPGGLGALMVSALLTVAADYLAEFAPDARPQAIDFAQEFLVRAVNAQVALDAHVKEK